MSGLPYYPRYPRDFFEGTVGLTLEEKGAYSLIIDLIMMMGERGLPDDPGFISGHLGCSVRKWNSIRERLISAGKIAVNLGIISNSRADKEKIIQRKSRDKNAENRARPNKNKGLQSRPSTYGSDTIKEPDTEPDNPLTPFPDEPARILAEVASLAVAQEFVAHRREMRKLLTARAAKAMVGKLRGHPDPDGVLQNSIANGWQGVFPDKVKASTGGGLSQLDGWL